MHILCHLFGKILLIDWVLSYLKLKADSGLEKDVWVRNCIQTHSLKVFGCFLGEIDRGRP